MTAQPRLFPGSLCCLLLTPLLGPAGDRQEIEKASIPVLAARETPYNRARHVLTSLPSSDNFPVNAVAFSPTEHLLVSSSLDQLLFWDLRTGKIRHNLPGYLETGTPHSLAFSPDGKWLAIDGADHQVRVIDVATGKVLRTLEAPSYRAEVRFTRDGKYLRALLINSSNKPASVRSWDTTTWKASDLALEPDRTFLWQMAPSGNLLAVVARPGFDSSVPVPIDIWDLTTGQKRTTRTPLRAAGVTFTSDEESLLVSAREANPVGLREEKSELWKVDLQSGEGKKETALEVPASRLEFTPDQKYLVFSETRSLRLVERSSSKERWSSAPSPGAVFSPGMHLLAVPSSYRVQLQEVEGFFHPRWADSGKAIARLREAGLALTLTGGKVHAASARSLAPAAFLNGFKEFSGITHLAMTLPEHCNRESMRGLELLTDLEELSLTYTRKPGPGILEPLRGLKKLRLLDLHWNEDFPGNLLAPLEDVESLETLNCMRCRLMGDEAIRPLVGLKNLRTVLLPECPLITSEGLELLARIPSLRVLNLNETGVRSDGLVHLAKLPDLEKLSLAGLGLRDESLEPLGKLTKLTDLDLSGNSTTDTGLKHLQDLTSLRRLSLRHPGKITGAGLTALKGCKDLESIDLSYGHSKDDVLAALGEHFPRLHTVTLDGTRYTDEGLKHLGRLKHLTRFRIDSKHIRGHGLAALKDCPGPEDLYMWPTRIDDEGIAGLKDWKQLRKLWVPPGVTAKGLAHLLSLEQLEELRISFNRHITPEGLRQLERLPHLRSLYLYGSAVDDRCVATLVGCKNLRDLNLQFTQVTPECFPSLAKMPNLRRLYLPQQPPIPQGKLAELRKALPLVSIR